MVRVLILEIGGNIVGFHIVLGDELYQFYVGADFRGTQVAAALIAHVETQTGQMNVNVWRYEKDLT